MYVIGGMYWCVEMHGLWDARMSGINVLVVLEGDHEQEVLVYHQVS